MEEIIRKSTVCRLALCDEGMPYIVPMCFGYQNDRLYFHTAPAGRKVDIIRKNSRVCFSFDADLELVKADRACGWGLKYRSVTGFGEAEIITDPGEKRDALDIIMGQYSRGAFQYGERETGGMVIIRVRIDRMTGKVSGYGGQPPLEGGTVPDQGIPGEV
jgi:nitroimidazol reductase NimA-like FMN-containing flavoprotein (pyridoxamine 5'-phosphate oxidase superfamily)